MGIIFNENKSYMISDSNLPVVLPNIKSYKPSVNAQPPLGRAKNSWINLKILDKNYIRETNTMPQWAGSCWYYLRFLDPKNKRVFCKKELEKYFMPVDLYIGGTEHSVLHLLYSRFWHKILYYCSLVTTKEPFKKLFNQGMIL